MLEQLPTKPPDKAAVPEQLTKPPDSAFELELPTKPPGKSVELKLPTKPPKKLPRRAWRLKHQAFADHFICACIIHLELISESVKKLPRSTCQPKISSWS